jgi:hypothetical protein
LRAPEIQNDAKLLEKLQAGYRELHDALGGDFDANDVRTSEPG